MSESGSARLPRRALLRGGVAAGALLGLAACSPAEPEPAPPPPAAPPTTTAAAAPPPSAAPTGPAEELVHATTGRPEVALTFHGAGNNTLDRKVLEALANGGAHVTVLAVGTWLAQYPDLAKMVTDLGHELGNHTWSHKTMTKLSVAQQRAEIERCRDQIDKLTGGPGAWFRQSAAQHATPELLKLAGAAGYRRVLSYDVDSLDWTDPGPATVRTQLRKAKAGSVVSMHLGHQGTLTAIPQILADLKQRNLTPVTATTLFA
ncbi:polysaccharide deacetylase family protein [Pseudonocardia spinosispora]|uniref:polysaccharide deacetylase family protein n=1 Tax=Pseudonocardia spinosispora TaxID=103441 RepID=UPI0004084ACA|nr:polysaccharide deacetylase family protein [Pseudonocardia spinosispora]